MRRALEPFSVKISDLQAGERKFKVEFDPKKTEMAKMLAALKKEGEEAKALD